MKQLLIIGIVLFQTAVFGQKMKIEADSSVPGYAKDEIFIKAEIKKVYGMVADIPNWKDWKPMCTESAVKGKTKKNAKFTWVVEGYKIKSKFHTVIPYSHLGWKSKKLVANAVQNFTFEEKDGGTLVTFSESLKGPLPKDLIDAVPWAVTNNLNHLKTAAEK
ncbi:MAG: SRPBCC family protein [Reichenbachiella sp.]